MSYKKRSVTIKVYSSFVLLPSFLLFLQVDAFLLTVVSTCNSHYDTSNFTKSLIRMYQHAATESP